MAVAYIGLGSNLGDREASLRRAVEMLRRTPGVRIVAASSLYETEPIEDGGPGHFLNAVAAVETERSPHALLEEMRAIESALGRALPPRRGPRVVDLDLLLFGEEEVADGRLRVPHPRMTRRAFVLVPLNEIAPHVRIRGKRPAEWLAALEEGQRVVMLKEASKWYPCEK